MKKLLLVLAVVVLLTTTAVPSFADGDPFPHLPTGTSCPVRVHARLESLGRNLDCNPAAGEL